MVMFHVKLSTALCSFLPFKPSFTARSWRFSWNSIAAREKQTRMSVESVRCLGKKNSCCESGVWDMRGLLGLLSLWGNACKQRPWHVLSTFTFLQQQKTSVCGSTETLRRWESITVSSLHAYEVIMDRSGHSYIHTRSGKQVRLSCSTNSSACHENIKSCGKQTWWKMCSVFQLFIDRGRKMYPTFLGTALFY